MSTKIILIVLGEPYSTFTEILMKYFNSDNFKKGKKKIILIGSYKLFKNQMKILKLRIKIKLIKDLNSSKYELVNMINVDYRFKTIFAKISNHSNRYIEKCFNLSLKLIKEHKIHALINGPVSKKHFLKKKFPGITEYIAKKTNSKQPVMLIYNKDLAVSPLTTHVPIKKVASFIKKKEIINNIIKIDNFYKSRLQKIPNIAVLGLNPHCETNHKISEEKREIIPAINFLKKKNFLVTGPIPADTFFLEKNIKKYDVVIGMYHDQVLSPIKTLFKFKAINITIGLPFIKVTPDHGPNHEMVGTNKSDASSIFYALNFLNKLR